MGDWLISYHGGSVRRGLPGEVILRASHWIHLNPYYVVAIVQLGLYGLIWYAVWELARKSNWPAWVLAALISPATLAFPVREFAEGYRKEELLIAGLALALLALRRPVRNAWVVVSLSAFTAVCILSHEGMVCFLPYLGGALYIGFRSARRLVLVAAVPAMIALACCYLAVTHPGNQRTVDDICRAIGFSRVHPLPPACDGAISYLALNSQQARQQVLASITRRHYYTVFPVVVVFAFLPLIAGGIALWRCPGERRSLLGIACAVVLSGVASVPLFYYAIDWSRWLYIHVFCTLLLLLFVAARSKPRAKARALAVHRSWAVAVLLVIYARAWRIPTISRTIPSESQLTHSRYCGTSEAVARFSPS